MAEIGGIDFAWTKPDPAATKKCGYSFVVGYLSNDATKNLSGAQFTAYRAAGLEVGLVWEGTATRASGGAAAGAVDGATAEAQANAIGYPAGCVIFFAVDFDAQPADFPAIAAYATAFNKATSRPVGIYGSYAVIEHFVTPGAQPVGYGWQTAAWSAGNMSAKAHLYQRVGHVNWPLIPGVAANSFDEDVKSLNLPLAGAVAPPPPPPPGVQGEIAQKYNTVPGLAAALGAPTTPETICPDGVGRFNHFANSGSIYWTSTTGAFAVYGNIRALWAANGWERGPLGYPVSDEFGVTGYDRYGAPTSWRQSNFQHGYITWTAAGGATQFTKP